MSNRGWWWYALEMMAFASGMIVLLVAVFAENSNLLGVAAPGPVRLLLFGLAMLTTLAAIILYCRRRDAGVWRFLTELLSWL